MALPCGGRRGRALVLQLVHLCRELAKTQFGRDPNNIKVLALVTPILGKTEEEAQTKLQEHRYSLPEQGISMLSLCSKEICARIEKEVKF
jgi:alkanesulfonate monooxygenase SsuD/methylene tetrahydromethanopterin reductase-like flavin-dependent oxidoreductase (luciferase family)